MNGREERRSKKICVTSTGSSPNDLVDPRFGRCAYFMIAENPMTAFKAVENDARGLGNGAGIQAAQTLARLGVEVLLTGDVGPNAFRVLSAASIRVFRAGNVSVRQAVAAYLDGQLQEISAPTTLGQHGGHGFGYGGRRGAGWDERKE